MRKDLLVFISVAGLLFMGWPGIEIFRGFMPQFLFIVWAVMIGAVALVSMCFAGKKQVR
ncbi:MAG: hypothetical protein RBT37_08020 [Dissulfurispiraceae bacterium]|jgi:hypothetical protein|nr:hypothetical protein [Dissulfurispiraceae bacterium]